MVLTTTCLKKYIFFRCFEMFNFDLTKIFGISGYLCAFEFICSHIENNSEVEKRAHPSKNNFFAKLR